MLGDDVFVEYMIRHQRSATDWLLLLGAVVLAGVLITASFWLAVYFSFPLIPYFVIIGVLYGLYRLWCELSLEYEYSFTNGDVTVDKIIAKRRRRRVVSFDAKDVELIAPVKGSLPTGKFEAVHRTGVYQDGHDGWAIVYSRQGGAKRMLLFSPDEHFLQAMKPFLPVRVRLDAFGRN